MRTFKNLWMLLVPIGLIILVACTEEKRKSPSWSEINKMVALKLLENPGIDKTQFTFAKADSGGGQDTMCVIIRCYDLSYNYQLKPTEKSIQYLLQVKASK